MMRVLLACLLLLAFGVQPEAARGEEEGESPASAPPPARVYAATWARLHVAHGVDEDDAVPVFVLLGARDVERDTLLHALQRARVPYIALEVGTPGPFPSHMDHLALVRTWAEQGLQWAAGVHRAVLHSPWILVGHDAFRLPALTFAIDRNTRYQGVLIENLRLSVKFTDHWAAVASHLDVVRTGTAGQSMEEGVVSLAKRGGGRRQTPRTFERVAPPTHTQAKFKAKDGVVVSGNYYPRKDKSAPVLLLCHQAQSSRAEYGDIAPRLWNMGYTCLALDQRSGRTWGGVPNKTVQRLGAKGKGPGFSEVRPDIDAAIDWLRGEGHDGKLAIVGSSYSAAIALIVGAERKDVHAVVAFSPGDYLRPVGSVPKAAASLDKPLLVVCPRHEEDRVFRVYNPVPSKTKQLYVQPEGKHGASTLFRSPTYAAVWKRLSAFLGDHMW